MALKDACGRKFFTTKNIRISNGDEQVVSARLISANEDGRGHDFLFIKNIDLYPENQIQIFNRWGIKVYEMRNYNNDSRSFRGIGNTNSISTELIAGVYYYVLTYKDLILNQDGVLKDYFIIKR
ncbi:gliding motility-associated C-terminal domain-containing protein [Paradesertivirga mongoliensis]|uniref:Gliding motility-associated C-terminal domain-containing protein n=1 Tax=Paradesertivirga mongoliensis TaxID=2100740 RepID=A0ABW4ZQA5_9SPHI